MILQIGRREKRRCSCGGWTWFPCRRPRMQDVHRYRRPIQRWGVPFDGLTDNGKQFTGKLARPLRIEVLFERTCREYGITARLTKRRSPSPARGGTPTPTARSNSSTGRCDVNFSTRSEHSRRSRQQTAIDEWIHAYNTHRRHPSLDMAPRRACSGHDRTKNRLLLPPRSSVWAHRSPRNRS